MLRRLLALLSTLGIILFSGGSLSGQIQVVHALSPAAVIDAGVIAENANDWVNYPSNWVEELQAPLHEFLSDAANAANHVGILNVKSAKFVSKREVPLEVASAFTNVPRYVAQYGQAKVYYVAVDYTVFEETKYYLNGTNYRLAVIVPQNGEWKLAEFSDAPVESLVALGYGFDTPDERQAVTQYLRRYQGHFVNRKGELLQTNTASPAQLREERGLPATTTSGDVTIQVDEHARPSTIAVYLTRSENKSYYNCSSNCTKSIDFYYYVKNVLPKEWYSTWPAESLKAGAEASKMYGWYHVYHPKWPQYNADVQDNTNDQVFSAGSETTSTTDAINAMGGIGLETATTHTVFEAHYQAGSYDSSGQNSGWVSQWGTKYWADKSKNYDYMLHYYYDNSPTTNNELMGYFSY